MPSLPLSARYVIIGAGIHGLSTAMHLAGRLRSKGTTVGAGPNRIVVLDKTGIGAGASGIACGVVRNNYYQPAMRELMAHSVSVWERDPDAYSYHSVGYMQISPEVMHAQVGTIYEQQKAIGYDSVFIEGQAESLGYMRTLFSDWQAENITSVLHEKRGGYANNLAAVQGLARKAEALGVDISGARTEDAGKILADRITWFMERLKTPNGLRALGYLSSDIPKLVEGTLPQHRVTKLSPRAAGTDELAGLFEEAMVGW